ncbi:glycosyltransferase family 2 protein [Azohydromonas caseinilytica]|uniref:Glycosyltransferase family 2 protein n=1 Tax=Azohydromonas caseinilytica TaxID=2728836 RepID=A0A848F9T8_9BURK|nr:glycosyltransferase family 2 protein [Azohydromonas caseinilytica]NML15083.1 glycosyltransferase family 2 protein [Azohydromonas caseinilytica]
MPVKPPASASKTTEHAAHEASLERVELSVIVVNWNGGELLRECIASLQRCLKDFPAEWEAIVVDNGSTDDSMQKICGLPCVVTVLNGGNFGFGRACNIGAQHARGRHLLFLNPDCEVHPGSIERCLAELQKPGIGACGIALTDESGHISRTCHRFPSLLSFSSRIFGLKFLLRGRSHGPMLDWDHSHDADVDHIIGAFYMVRHDTFKKLEGFDERFFVYLEDLDLSLRVKKNGGRIRFLASPPSFHVGGGVSRQIKALRLFYSTRSRILYAYKHFPRWQAHLHLLLTLLVEPVARTGHALLQRSMASWKESLVGLGLVWLDLPNILRTLKRSDGAGQG